MDPWSSSTKRSTKLSVKNQTHFKKSSLSFASKKRTDLVTRKETILRKAKEGSILCDIEMSLFCYDYDGELIDTWPEDKSKVKDIVERLSKLSIDPEGESEARDIVERFSKLSIKDKRKKNTNLPSNYSSFLYDHDNDTLMANSASSFEQSEIPHGYGYSSMLLEEQVKRGCNNIDFPMDIAPPMMKTQTPLFQFDQFASWNQTPSFGNQMMLS